MNDSSAYWRWCAHLACDDDTNATGNVSSTTDFHSCHFGMNRLVVGSVLQVLSVIGWWVCSSVVSVVYLRARDVGSSLGGDILR